MDERPDLDSLGRKPALELMSTEEFEDFLTEAIGCYAEQTGTPIARLRTFAEARLPLNNKGLVVGIGNVEFRISITKSG